MDQIIDPAQADAALSMLSAAKRVLVPTHQNVDADGLATPLALMHALKPQGIEIVPVVTDGKIPKSLQFLPGIRSALRYGVDPLPEFDLLCMLDCSDRRRLAMFYEDDPSRVEGAYPIVNIDHHVTNDHFGVVNIVVPEASATAEIMAELLKYWGIRLTKTIAQCLLAGIYGDTLGLRTDSTRSRTMRTSADLVDAGANPSRITDSLFRLKPKSTVCLWEHALRDVRWSGSLIWTEVNAETLRICGADASEAEGIVNFLSGTDGSRAAAMLYQTDTGYRVSMRSLSDDVDVAAILSNFGGGGHPRAAGATVQGGPQERDAFLESVAALLEP
ncbi:MAG: bifunctional oligoribonuclease/PAP phosphatase NrnA [Chloroflexota bacterium]|nr:bifunctional oligoribonuclease/PAP phosphatase NrnA [Chloroflexota bacterium]